MSDPRYPAPWQPPEVFEEYRLVRTLGRGGMGQVYLGQDMLLERPVAIKFIALASPDAISRERFVTEARAVARLAHPNVVAIYRVGECEGRPFLISELVRGKNLAELHKPVPWERALKIALGLSRGLGAAHRQGVMHRDIKPANVMLTDDDEVKLLDFGLAKLMSAQAWTGEDTPAPSRRSSELNLRSEISDPGMLVGTPLYMAPEALRGDPATYPCDIYSAGCVLYELCTGRPPRMADLPENSDTRNLRLPGHEVEPESVPSDVVVPLGQRAPLVDPRFAAIVDRCLQPEPALRFSSGDQLRDALEQLLPTPETATLPPGNPYRGLLPFEAEHRALFFGRGPEIRALTDRLRTEPMVLVAGDSGAGKSSLCRAGVLPRCADGALEGGRTFQIVSFMPGARPLHTLLRCLAPLVRSREEDLQKGVHSDPGLIGRLLRRRFGIGTLIFIDQMEELVTLSDPEEARQVSEILGDLAVRSSAVRLLMTARVDFLTRLAQLPRLGDEILRALYLLRPLGPEGTRDAVVGPAHRTGVRFESEALIGELVQASTQAAGGLPLLQFALAELWEARDPASQLIPALALQAIGGVGGALARHADQVLLALTEAQQQAARRILLRLVTPEGTRTRRGAAELELRDPAASGALEALIRSRLLVVRQLEGHSVYEVAHEALIDGWGTLRRWLDADIDRHKLLQRLDGAVAEWERLGRAREALWSQRQLTEAAALDPAELPERDLAFLAASRQRAVQVRRGRRVLIGVVPIFLVIVYAVVLLKVQQDLDKAIAGQVERAQTVLAGARAHAAEGQAARLQAFAAFDGRGTKGEAGTGEAGRWRAAEALWATALARDAQAESAYVGCGQILESALNLDVHRAAVRHLLGDVTLERIQLSERRPLANPLERSELEQRLGHFDEGGARRALLRAPGRLRIGMTPVAAAVEIERYQETEGKWQLVPVLSLPAAQQIQVKLERGSYLLRLVAPGRPTVRLPILIARGEDLAIQIDLPARVPAGYVHVPPGRFLLGSAGDEDIRKGFLDAPPLHQVHNDGFLIGETEVTFAQWLEFLRDLPRAERARRTPRTVDINGGLALVERADGRFALTLQPSTQAYRAAEGEPIRYGGRDRRATQDWLRFPVSAISCEDADAYLAWLSRSGRLPGARLCTEQEWERAARGADGRIFPHGSRVFPEDANYDETYGRDPLGFGPDEVGMHPASVSPFGLQDMTGNVWEWVRSARNPKEVVLRGGSWYQGELTARINNRNVGEPTMRNIFVGLRVCAPLHQAEPDLDLKK